jgi:hypothetical protein
MIIGALDLKEVPAIITRGSVRTSNWREQSAKHDSHSINLKTIINDALRLYQPSKAMRVRLASFFPGVAEARGKYELGVYCLRYWSGEDSFPIRGEDLADASDTGE